MDKESWMSEREAFDWWKTEQDEAGYKQSEIARLAWQAACKWQRDYGTSSLARFRELGGESEPDPLERLRFFCSLAMNSQDWLDVEPFFDDVSAILNQGSKE